MLRLMGDTFRAFVYKIIALISSGRAHSVAAQKVLSRGGKLIKSKLNARRGSEKRRRAHATKYSFLEERTRLVKASLVAKKKAVNRE
jgi:hypothetical protein